jgi:Rod binding domain-containing protein
MADLPVSLLQPAPTPLTGAAKTRAEIARSAEEFEATFLSSMLATMFQGVKPQAPFHGGAGEDAFQSFLTDAMAKSLAKAGGIGLTDTLSRELLKLQGLEAAA